MTVPIAAMNRAEIRAIIASRTGAGFVGEATSTAGDSTSLLDSVYLYKGGTNEYRYRMVKMITGTANNIGLKAVVASSTQGDATLSVAMVAAITDGDTYEMWEPDVNIDDIDNLINEVIRARMKDCYKIKETHATFTQSEKYEYDCLSSFIALSKVEYVYSIEEEVEIDDCDSAWTAGTNVTVTADASIMQEGSACNKLVVAAGAAATAVLAYNTFSAKDLSDCDELEISIYPTVALTAGQWQVRLDDTSGGGSPVESLNIPASPANTWTRHKITLANPLSDTAVVRVEIYQVTDVGAITAYIDYIKAVRGSSRIYKEVPAIHWDIVQGSTNYLKLTSSGLSLTGENVLLRLTGYQKPTEFSDDSTDSDLDPVYIALKVSGELLMQGMVMKSMDTKAREEKAIPLLAEADRRLREITTNPMQGTRFI